MKENVQNIEQVHNHISKEIYPKRDIWGGLMKNPCILSLVAYFVNENGQLQSRVVHSCCVFVTPNKQETIDIEESKSDEPINTQTMKQTPNVVIDMNQFQSELVFIEKSKANFAKYHQQQQWYDRWQLALMEIQQFDSDYNRPRHLSFMSEQQRKGIFDNNNS